MNTNAGSSAASVSASAIAMSVRRSMMSGAISTFFGRMSKHLSQLSILVCQFPSAKGDFSTRTLQDELRQRSLKELYAMKSLCADLITLLDAPEPTTLCQDADRSGSDTIPNSENR